MNETASTFTCDSCGKTFDKGWSDEEAAAEAQANFPGMNVSGPDETGVVCDDCFNAIMEQVSAQAPSLIGAAWRGNAFTAYITGLIDQGYTRNECREHCQDRGSEHAHLKTPDGEDVILWADGRWSGYDLTQPARLIYPAARNAGVLGYDMVLPKWPEGSGWTPMRDRIPRACYRMANGSMVHVKPDCRCPR